MNLKTMLPLPRNPPRRKLPNPMTSLKLLLTMQVKSRSLRKKKLRMQKNPQLPTNRKPRRKTTATMIPENPKSPRKKPPPMPKSHLRKLNPMWNPAMLRRKTLPRKRRKRTECYLGDFHETPSPFIFLRDSLGRLVGHLMHLSSVTLPTGTSRRNHSRESANTLLAGKIRAIVCFVVRVLRKGRGSTSSSR